MPDELGAKMVPGVEGQSPMPMAPPAGTPDAGSAPPASGEIEQAKANMQIALTVMEQALPSFSAESKEKKAILKAINSLTSVFAQSKSKELAPAALMQMLAGMPDQYKERIASELGPGAGAGTQPTGAPQAGAMPPQG